MGARSGAAHSGGHAAQDAGGAGHGDAGAGGASGDEGVDGGANATGGGTAGGDGSTEREPSVGLCPFELHPSLGQRLGVSTPSADLFGAVTPDESTIAWTTVDGELTQLHTAERARDDQPFGSAQTLTIDAAPDRVGLSPDGLRVLYVDADRKAFSVVAREAQGDEFRQVDPAEALLLNGADRELGPDELYGDPVIGGDDLQLLYSRFGGGRRHTFFISRRTSPDLPWPEGIEIANGAFFDARDDYDRFQPTGLSSDGKTLFLWHESEMQEYAGFFDAAHLRLVRFTALGELSGAMPNASCTRLYYDNGGVSGDLFFASIP